MNEQNIDLVIFGGLGDLAGRKLLPALYQIERAGLLSDRVRLAAVARDPIETKGFLDYVEGRLKQSLASADWSESVWQKLSKRFSYIGMDFSNKKHFSALNAWLDSDRLVIYYLATPPSLFGAISQHLHDAGCIASTSRIVLEKPIGHDLASSKSVNDTVARYFTERNIYRIDHYLGKETVQNLLALRFANRLINSQWDNTCIDHVQITVSETVGIEGRWGYYDQVGQLRDMVQNHLLQLLCMVAMEPPNSFEADEIRAEKVKILRALTMIDASDVEQCAVRGQYAAGWIAGQPVVGYTEEIGCSQKDSATETFVAIKAFIDNWRWSGVPFYLRTGKRLGEKATQIVIAYKNQPHAIFPDRQALGSNRLVIRLQPNEGIQLEMASKKQTLKDRLSLEKRLLNLDFFDTEGQDRIPDAYERLLLEVFKGDQWLFVSRGEIEASWRWCDQLIGAWQDKALKVHRYSAGSSGPSKAELLIERDGRSWFGESTLS
ncbi:MAG: glucose-6-phosphate dehydrogenase [Pseudomonadales bacterium]|jgi:glucose-6-phosphate 1-dehydrogenase|nr:glucose-6-phosphate dehydrogenase [Pseudomonadales bacterium]MDA0958949.1 glucose-6-phosphate dehydrogenase [Pseudomonadota bacterium]